MAINGLLARLGSSDPIEPFSTLTPLIETFSLEKFSKATPKFSLDELRTLNAKILHHLSFKEALERLQKEKIMGVEEILWNSVRGNIQVLKEIKTWVEIIQEEIVPFEPLDQDREYIKTALEYLPNKSITEETWKTWTDTLKTLTGRKGRALFMPLRLALTGHEHGPEMKNLLPLMGYKKIRQRLENVKGLS